MCLDKYLGRPTPVRQVRKSKISTSNFCHLVFFVSLPHVCITSRVVTCTGSDLSIFLQQFLHYFPVLAFACLASLNFLRLGGELKVKIVGTASNLSVRLDGPKPSAPTKHRKFQRNGRCILRKLASYMGGSTSLNFSSHLL